MADDEDYSEWMGVILDVFNDRPDKTYLVKVVGVDHWMDEPTLITQSMDGKGLMHRVALSCAPACVPPKKLKAKLH